VFAHGKHLFIEFDNALMLRSHLGMYGAWHRYGHGETWHRPARQAGVVLETRCEVYVCFNPKEVELLRTDGLRARDLGAHLGPDLIGATPEPTRLVARARELLEAETPLADVLLDQRIAAGIGNVYKSELLFLEGLAPTRRLSETSDAQLGSMYQRAAELLAANTEGGPRRTRDVGHDGGTLWVYGRADHPCLHCGTPVRRALLGRHQRSTYWCPTCQD
jgi:endonuclease-8